AADTDVITGGKATFTLIDETHVLALKAKFKAVMAELRGALAARPDGFLLQITTQSKEPPTGGFRDELHTARDVRDGKLKLPLLAVMYELPESVRDDWQNPDYWGLVNPNLEASVSVQFLRDELAALALFASQHFNVEIGIGLRTDRWAGADFWKKAEDSDITFEHLLEVCDVIIAGADGGGLDDLFGFGVVGRHKDTRDWLIW